MILKGIQGSGLIKSTEVVDSLSVETHKIFC